MAQKTSGSRTGPREPSLDTTELVGTPVEGSGGRAAVAVRALCVNGEVSRAIVGYGDDDDEAYRNAAAEARAFCRHHGGTQKITKI